MATYSFEMAALGSVTSAANVISQGITWTGQTMTIVLSDDDANGIGDDDIGSGVRTETGSDPVVVSINGDTTHAWVGETFVLGGQRNLSTDNTFDIAAVKVGGAWVSSVFVSLTGADVLMQAGVTYQVFDSDNVTTEVFPADTLASTVPVLNTTQSVVDQFGWLGLLSTLSLAAYELQAHEVTGNFSPAASPAADALEGPLYFLQTADFPSLAPVASGNADNPQDGFLEGFYTSANAGALVARTQDSLFVAFRGTNGPGDAVFDDWLFQSEHVAQYDDLFLELTAYLEANADITNLYLTGHSLGSSMADYWTNQLNGDGLGVTIENVTFAAPGVFTNLPEFDNAASFRFNGDVIGLPAATSDNFGDLNVIVTDVVAPAGLHGINIYNRYVDFIQSQGITLDNMTTPFHGVDYDRIIVHGEIVGGGAFDVAVGAGVDSIFGAGMAEIILGGALRDIIYGNGGIDHIDGGTGNDLLSGGAGADFIHGRSGTDSITGGTGHDSIMGGLGYDTLHGHGGNDTLEGGGGNDHLTGGSNADDLSGGTGQDTLLGGAQADTLDGGAGNDTLEGGTGRDVMTGGGGRDTFVFNSLGETNATARDNGHALTWSADVITDFNAAQDIIDLSAIDAQRFRPGDAFTFVGEADLIVFERGQLSYYTDNGTTVIHGSNDGDIWSDFAIRLTGEHVLSEANFIL